MCDIKKNACNETNLTHYLLSVYSVTIPLHVSGLLVAHHQEVTMYICNKRYVLYILVKQKRTTRTVVEYIHCYLLMMGN
jgi:hypothetical protein